jgi:hypothetical protein
MNTGTAFSILKLFTGKATEPMRKAAICAWMKGVADAEIVGDMLTVATTDGVTEAVTVRVGKFDGLREMVGMTEAVTDDDVVAVTVAITVPVAVYVDDTDDEGVTDAGIDTDTVAAADPVAVRDGVTVRETVGEALGKQICDPSAPGIKANDWNARPAEEETNFCFILDSVSYRYTELGEETYRTKLPSEVPGRPQPEVPTEPSQRPIIPTNCSSAKKSARARLQRSVCVSNK